MLAERERERAVPVAHTLRALTHCTSLDTDRQVNAFNYQSAIMTARPRHSKERAMKRFVRFGADRTLLLILFILAEYGTPMIYNVLTIGRNTIYPQK